LLCFIIWFLHFFELASTVKSLGRVIEPLKGCQTLEWQPGLPAEGGIDVGAGGDRTVIRERRGDVAGREHEFIDADPMRTVGELVEAIRAWGLSKVKIDSTGIGWAIAGRLQELSSKHNRLGERAHDAEVVPVNFGAGPTDGLEKKFLNKRAELWWNARELSRPDVRGWDLTAVDDDVIAELTAPKYEVLDSYGKIKIEPKKEVIKRLGFSPDRAEALLLAFLNTVTTASIQSVVEQQLPTSSLSGPGSDRMLTLRRAGLVR
jgi:hypothetical protein